MDWDDLRHVLAISRNHSLSAAGSELGVRHTTVSRRLQRLEDRLGVRPFDRTPTRFQPTAAGGDLIELATETEAAVLAAEGRIKGQDTALAGELRVSTLDWIFEAHAEAFASFCQAYPTVELTVLVTETEVSLFRREADVALRLTNTPPETLVGRRLSSVQFAVYGSRALVDAGEGRWCDYPWLHWDERTEMARWLDRWLERNVPGAQIALRLGENTLVRRTSLKLGLGLHPLPCFEGDREPDLVRVGPILDDFERGLWLLTLPALRHTRRVRAFMDHLSGRSSPSAGDV